MKRGKLSMVLISSLALVLLVSTAVMAESGFKNESLQKGVKYMKDIKSGMENIKDDMQTFSKSNNKDSLSKDIKDLEKLLEKAEGYKDKSRKILASTLKLKMQGLKNSSSHFVQSFEESLVSFAERYNELARTWYDMLFHYEQNAEKLVESFLLLGDDATEIAKGFLDKAKKEMNSGGSGQ
jgi:septal ring factor EnvC (AmiA/AmiB activator)